MPDQGDRRIPLLYRARSRTSPARHYNLGNALLEESATNTGVGRSPNTATAIELDPELRRAPTTNLRHALRGIGISMPDEAIAEYRRAIELDPELSPSAHY